MVFFSVFLGTLVSADGVALNEKKAGLREGAADENKAEEGVIFAPTAMGYSKGER
jgi:hypothetical protein